MIQIQIILFFVASVAFVAFVSFEAFDAFNASVAFVAVDAFFYKKFQRICRGISYLNSLIIK